MLPDQSRPRTETCFGKLSPNNPLTIAFSAMIFSIGNLAALGYVAVGGHPGLTYVRLVNASIIVIIPMAIALAIRTYAIHRGIQFRDWTELTDDHASLRLEEHQAQRFSERQAKINGLIQQTMFAPVFTIVAWVLAVWKSEVPGSLLLLTVLIILWVAHTLWTYIQLRRMKTLESVASV